MPAPSGMLSGQEFQLESGHMCVWIVCGVSAVAVSDLKKPYLGPWDLKLSVDTDVPIPWNATMTIMEKGHLLVPQDRGGAKDFVGWGLQGQMR